MKFDNKKIGGWVVWFGAYIILVMIFWVLSRKLLALEFSQSSDYVQGKGFHNRLKLLIEHTRLVAIPTFWCLWTVRRLQGKETLAKSYQKFVKRLGIVMSIHVVLWGVLLLYVIGETGFSIALIGAIILPLPIIAHVFFLFSLLLKRLKL